MHSLYSFNWNSVRFSMPQVFQRARKSSRTSHSLLSRRFNISAFSVMCASSVLLRSPVCAILKNRKGITLIFKCMGVYLATEIKASLRDEQS